MNQARRMDRSQCACDDDTEKQSVVDSQRPVPEKVSQRPSTRILHGEKGAAVLKRPECDERGHVGVLHGAQCICLALEVGCGRDLPPPGNLERDDGMRAQITRTIDAGCATLADLIDDNEAFVHDSTGIKTR